MKLPDWLTRTVGIIIGVAVIIVLLLAISTVRSCQSASAAKVESNLANGQADAAFKSAADAIETTSNSAATADQIHTQVKDATDAIDKAPVGYRNDAADRATCQLRSYRHSVRCVALLGPVAP